MIATIAGTAPINPICSPLAPTRAAYTDKNARTVPFNIPNQPVSLYKYWKFRWRFSGTFCFDFNRLKVALKDWFIVGLG
jgi:hypothetical protein